MLKDKVILITGSSGRLGAAFCEAVLSNGGKVVMVDVAEPKNKPQTDNAIFVKADTTDVTQIDVAIAKGSEKFGKIDAAVHSAYPRSKQWGARFEDLKPEGLFEDLGNQLGGAILFSQRVVEFFKKQGHGNLIHISSIQGVSAPKFEHYAGTKMVSPIEYSAIKSGIIAVTRYLAKYCKNQNIRVNCISPGGILDAQPDVFLEKYKNSCSSKGMLNANDINGALLFLLSDGSLYVTGQNIIVDDGWVL